MEKDNYRCECKELIDNRVRNKAFIWSSSNCECEYDKVFDFGEYIDYENCKCRKKLVAPLIEECTETVEEVKPAKTTLAENKNSCKCNSCAVHIVLFSIVFTISVGIITYYLYSQWYLKKDAPHVDFNTRTQTTIY